MPKTSLSEEDYLGIIDLHSRFVGCKNWADLNDCLLRHLLPLLNCDSMAYGLANLDIAAGQLHPTSVTGLVGKMTKEVSDMMVRLTPYSKSMNKKLLTSARSVVACDVDVPRKTVHKEFDLYYRDHPEHKSLLYSLEYRKSGYMASIDKVETDLGMGIQRWSPNDKPFTLRDVRVMELVRPILFQTIKTIALSEELAKYKSIAESLADIPTGVALVRKDMRVVFLNKSFRESIPPEPGHKLPPDLAMAVQKEIDNLSKKMLEPFPEIPFYKLSKETFGLSIDPVTKGDEGECWLLRLKPADDSFSQMRLRMQEGNLGNREKEICCLVKDGFSDAEMASRLFISLHTVRTHMKNIHQKLDVQSRAKLVAMLNKTG
ncbi:MAG: hypothetical protein A3K09_08560 [Nitrospinae bacterium RIFCSPLOWO2_12_FULL_47_7]|nr:MAG: hypothetical protein A3K09_08560 [Nitrospinae bacterium RIFCSPLOWO2_12_FULL_47_7]